jgi:PAS domain S-box-containing protein
LALTPLIEDQKISGILVVSIDATERVQVQHDLQESQRTLNTLISNLPGMAYRCRNDRTWSMDFVSKGSLELTGYTPEELTWRGSIEYADLIHPEDKKLVWDQVQDALKADQPFQLQYRIQARSGKKWVWEQGQAIRDQDGEVMALEGFITDITERMQSRQDLEGLVAERTNQLSTLLDFSHNLALTLELEELLDLILDQLGEVVPYHAASIMILEKELLRIIAYQGPIPREQARQIQFTLQDAQANQQVIQSREPLIIDDVYGSDPMAVLIRKTAGEDLETIFSYLKCWMGVPLIVKDQTIGMLSLDHSMVGAFDAAQAQLAQVFANQAAVAIENARLYAESKRRADESEALFAVQQAITSKLELDEVLQMIADQARSQTNTDISAVYLLKGNELEISYVSGDVPQEIIGYRLSLEDSLAGYVVRNKCPALVPDTREDPRVDLTAAGKAGARSLLVVPLIAGDKTIGTITVANNIPRGFTREDERLLTQLAANVVISVENAQLYQAEQDRRLVAESMRDIIGLINADLDLDSFLDRAVELAANRLGAGGCVLDEFDLEREILVHRASFGLERIFEKGASRSFSEMEVSGDQGYLQATLEQRPTYTNYGPLPDQVEVIRRGNSIPEQIQQERIILRQKFASSFSVPLFIRDLVYGGMVFYYTEPQEFSEQQIELGLTFADQVALAIENAHLFEVTEESAVADERDRLARDLHDAVTQTLFSTSLIAEVLPVIWDKDPQQGRERLEEIRNLTRGALAEMRSLLMELRPTALEETGISDLLQQLREAFVGRTGTPVEIEISGECTFPVDVKVTVYRVVQEALNNIAKHARASSCQISLSCGESGFSLQVRDDGEGFDPEVTSSDSLGLGIMRDRADGIGARLMVNSVKDRGTEVRLDWEKKRIKDESNQSDQSDAGG